MSDEEMFYLYLYRKSLGGKHERGVKTTTKEFSNLLGVLMADQDICEIVMADTGDECVFHYKDGKILFPT